jgi:hypothetical protein
VSSQKRLLFDRRRLIVGGVVAIASALIAAPVALRSTRRHVRKILEDQFGRDVVSGEAADRFIADIAKKLDEPSRLYEAVARMGAVYFHEMPLFRRKSLEIEDVVLTEFLKRTNAYRRFRGADEELIYVSLDPYEVGCGNFLAVQFKPD